MRNLIILLSSLVLIFACSNTSDEDVLPQSPPVNPPIYLLHKIFKDGNLITERTYSVDSILTSQIRYNSFGSLFQRQEYSYSGDTIITISFNGNNDTTQLRYSYPVNNSTVRVDRLMLNGTLDNYAIYSFMDDSCAFTSYRFYKPDGSSFLNAEIDYMDANCSSISYDYDGVGNLLSSQRIIRDDKRSPSYKLVKLFRSENQGNILEAETKDENGNINMSASYVNVHVYHQLGYLESTTTSFLDNTIENYTYEYW